MKIFIQRADGDYWRRGSGWVAGRDSATVFQGVVQALDCCMQSVAGDVDIVLEFTGTQAVRLRHEGRSVAQ